MDLVASRAAIVTTLKALDHGVGKLRVVTSLAKVNAPCVFVAMESVDPAYSAGGEVTWRIYLVAAYTDDERAIAQLQNLLEVVLPVLSPAAVIEYVGLPVPEQSQPLPALLIRITDTV